MEESSKMLEKTKLINLTETVFVGDDTASFTYHNIIISNGRTASELANLINDRLS